MPGSDGAPERCGVRALHRGDPLVGTAFAAARVLLVEQPGPWGRAGLAESGLDATVAADLVARAGAAGIRVQAVRRPGRTPAGAPRRWALADTGAGAGAAGAHVAPVRHGTVTDDAELAALPLDGSAGDVLDGPLWLVCAHSRHDPCCAVAGREVAAALHALRPGRVFETSHLGGDRFAANVLALPGGDLYGRVPVTAAAALVAATEAGEVLPDLLRGRIGLSPVVQAAAVAAMQARALRRRDAVDARSATVGEAVAVAVAGAPDALGTVVESATLTRVGLATAAGPVEVEVRAETRLSATGLSCAKPGPARLVAHTARVLD